MSLSLRDFLKFTVGGPASLASAGLVDDDKVADLLLNPKKELESTFQPEFGAPEMRQSQQMLADALRANPVPTTDEARRTEDYMRQARRRRGRAASVLAGRSETSTPLGSTGAPPAYGARSVLG